MYGERRIYRTSPGPGGHARRGCTTAGTEVQGQPADISSWYAGRSGRCPDGRRQRRDSQRPPARTASELANIFVLAIRAGLPAGGTEEDCVRVSYTDIQPAVVALEQLLFYWTETGRAPSDPDPLDFVTARTRSPLIHHPDFIVALLRACTR